MAVAVFVEETGAVRGRGLMIVRRVGSWFYFWAGDHLVAACGGAKGGGIRKHLQVNAREYLADVLRQLVFVSSRPKVGCRPADLTPRAWMPARVAKAEPKVEEKATPG